MPHPHCYVSFLALILATSSPSGAAPTGTPEGSGASVPTLCERGFAYSRRLQRCVRLGSDTLEDQDLLRQARALAEARRYESALEMMQTIGDKNNAEVLTMLGFIKRKSGRIEEGIEHYHQALAMDPDNADAREYLGEGYAESGRVDLALMELEKIEAICGNRECEQYRDLEAAIALADDRN